MYINRIIMVLIVVFLSVSLSEAATTTQPATGKVLKVIGKVQHKPISEKKWTSTKVNDTLSSGMEIRTGLRSSALIKLHINTIVQVKSATRIAFTELAAKPQEEKTRIALSYGTVRAGIVTEKVRSDFQIACPTAVLSREGTWGMEMSYDPATGGYRIGLDTDGLVRVLQTQSGKRMKILPGQFVTNQMQQWVQTAVFERMVSLTDPFGVTKIEKEFYANNSGGQAGSDPTGSDLGQAGIMKGAQAQFVKLRRTQLAARSQQLQIMRQTLQDIINNNGEIKTHPYRFGNFGTHIPSDTNIWSALKQRKLRKRK